MLKIQGEIAELFGLKFDVENISARAYQLRTRLMDTKRKIIILDDVWESLRFEDLGIPVEIDYERCKVLLTSRNKDTYKGIKNKKVFELETLEQEEAWNLFRQKAGKCVEDLALHNVAKDVVAECHGLPIALVTVGLALQGVTNIHKWKYSLSELRKSNPYDFPQVLRDVYKPLKLSYDYLDNDSEQYVFLLCCLFPKDYDIPVEQLTWYSMGLGLFDDLTNIEEARNRTHRLFENLKSRFLLIDGWDKLHVKMHNVARDVAKYIGSREKNGFLKSLTSIKNLSNVNCNCNWMSVDLSKEPMEVPVGLCFPKLRLLMLLNSNEFSVISFEGMENLNVLSFSSTSIGSLPPTLQLLKNLQTMCLVDCEVENISVIGELTSLKIFSCYECENIKELPAEIGRLSGLRLLELNGCSKLQRIPFGVISRLRRLEELKMRRSFRRWEAEENGKERRNASLTELECLPNLTCLEIEIDDWNLAAQDICLSPNLVKYCIRMASPDYWIEHKDYSKVMILNLPSGAVGKWIQMGVRNTECLYLEGDGSNNFNIVQIATLMNLGVGNCSTLKKLVETKDCTLGIVFPWLETLELWSLHNLEEICQRTIIPDQKLSLCHLKSINISFCSNLRSLLPMSLARSLSQLEVLNIVSCDAMEQVFWNEIRDKTDACIEFPKLKKLILDSLPNLTAFCQRLENIIKFPNLTELRIGDLPKFHSLSSLNSKPPHDHTTSFHLFCDPKVEMGCLKDLTFRHLGNNIRNIWCHQIPFNFFNNLQELTVYHMDDIRSLMSYSIAKNLVSLKYLSICACEEMIEVIEVIEGDDIQVVDISCLFPTLERLSIWGLHKLKRFWQWDWELELPLLEEVDITDCPVMETFTLGYLNTPNIREIDVDDQKIDDQKDLNDVIHHFWSEYERKYQCKDKGKEKNVDNDEDEEEKIMRMKMKRK